MGITDWVTLRRRLVLATGTGVFFFFAAVVSDLAARRTSGLEALWPCNAIVLGILIGRARGWRDVGAIGAGSVAASFLFHLVRADGAVMTLTFCIANVSESVIAFLLLRRFCAIGSIFDRAIDVVALVVSCGLAAFVSASVGALGLTIGGGMRYADAWIEWYCSGVLGQIVVAPMIIISLRFSDQRRLRKIAAHTVAEVVVQFGLVAFVAGFVFFWSTLPLLFLIAPFVLAATLRLRAFGAAGAVWIVAVIAATATAIGDGPIAHALPSPVGQALLLQSFLACCFLIALPIAAMLTERDVRAEDARLLADRFKAVVENIGEVIFRIDADGHWAYLNPAWETLTGFPTVQSVGRDWLYCVEPGDRPELIDKVGAVLRGEQASARRVARFNTAVGPRWMEIFIQCLRDQQGAITGAAGTLRDIDDRKRLEEHVIIAKRRAEQRAREATMLASTDELTGIANRRAFLRQLDREIAGAAEFGWPLAVAIFDVDHFKAVNDRHGHAVGDRVLQQIAGRAGAAVRGGDLVGRIGGEEFGILMPGATAEDAAIVAERLRQAMEKAPGEDGLPGVTVSVGIAAREYQRDASALLAVADVALYDAKSSGRNRVRIAA